MSEPELHNVGKEDVIVHYGHTALILLNEIVQYFNFPINFKIWNPGMITDQHIDGIHINEHKYSQ